MAVLPVLCSRNRHSHADNRARFQVEAVIAETAALKKKQETPDTAEALASIPSLALSDIPTKISTIHTDIAEHSGATILQTSLRMTLYLEAGLEMKGVPAPLVLSGPLV
jgi:Zn-dependent M16 (insulinase) family peptidase